MARKEHAQTKRKNYWQLQEAKAMFSDVIKAAVDYPQIITVRGKETAVILSFEEYQRMTAPRQSLFNFIQNSPLYGVDLELPERLPEEMREVVL